jgi:hypothetical protein
MSAELLQDDMRARHELVDRVAAHPDLLPAEKETTIGWVRDDDAARMHTDEAAIARALLRHPHVGIDRVVLHTGVSVDVDAAVESGAAVGSIIADVPIALLKIGKKPRGSALHSRVVSRWDK